MQILPDWIQQKLASQYPQDADRIAAGFTQSRSATFRCNALKATAPEVKEELARNGIAFRTADWYSDLFLAENADESVLQKLPLYEEGKIYLQSFSSCLPPLYLEAQEGESVLDMAAAPGGKTTQISALTGGKAFITACEKDKVRADRLRFNVVRQGAPRTTVLNTDATKLDEFFSFDRILLDAPCSGSGTLNLNLPLKISEALVRNIVSVQEKLLRKALKILKKGGTLVYSTCSVFQEENEELVRRVLKTEGGTLVPVKPFPSLPVLPSMEGTLCVCPDMLYEGFFVAKIQK